LIRLGVDVHMLQQIAADYKDALKQAASADAIVACIGEPNYSEKPGDIDTAPLPLGLTDFIGKINLHSSN
jgi:hypothetical protein